MLLRDLPSDILSIVLAKAAKASDGKVDGFYYALPLLAVCRQWRHLALPIVYADAYYVYGSGCYKSYRRSFSRRDVKKTRYPYRDTNVYLIASVGCISRVKRVHITSMYMGRLPGRLSVIARRLKKVAAVWPRVESVAFHDTYANLNFNAEDAQALANMFIVMFPGVRQLDVDGLEHLGEVTGLGTWLAAGYARQLRVYKGDTVVLPQGCVLERLERAMVSCGSATELYGQSLQPSRLQHLSLKIVWRGHPWC